MSKQPIIVVEVSLAPSPTAFFIWTIYDHPKDHPEGFIARKWWCPADFGDLIPTSDTETGFTLEEVRRFVKDHGVTKCFPRDPLDDPVIVEGWI